MSSAPVKICESQTRLSIETGPAAQAVPKAKPRDPYTADGLDEFKMLFEAKHGHQPGDYAISVWDYEQQQKAAAQKKLGGGLNV